MYLTMNGKPIHFMNGTPENLKEILYGLYKSGARIRLFYGSHRTGQDWLEEHDTVGVLATSTGVSPALTLLNNSRSSGGPAILTANIVKITVGKQIVYVHPLYHLPELVIKETQVPELPWQVEANGVPQATFGTYQASDNYLLFLMGIRNRVA